MSSCNRNETIRAAAPLHFQTTHWSAVLAAGRSGSLRQAEALEDLCRAYWYPVYGHVRQRGYGPEDAQDLTQEFLARLVHNNWLADLDPHTGRFRSFLLTVLHRFLINEYDRGRAAKRGGGKTFISLDQSQAEGWLALETASNENQEKTFDRRWALALLEQALSRLRTETREAGKSRPFELLSPFLSRDAQAGDYAEISKLLGLSAGAVGVAVHRLRQRYREILREEVRRTVADAAEAEAEMLHLFAALRDQF